jgi:hypothetical protein
MDEGQSRTGPQPTEAFDHPAIGAFEDQSTDDRSGYSDQDEDVAAPATRDAGAGADVLPPREAMDVSREPLVSQSRGR